jgi:hypothetical protein
MKHLDLREHFIKELVDAGEVDTRYIPSKEKVADIFTKALPKSSFLYLRQKLNVLQQPQDAEIVEAQEDNNCATPTANGGARSAVRR